MKKFKLILSIALLFASVSTFAQMYGMGRNNSEIENKMEMEKRKEYYEKEKLKSVQKSIDQMKIDLELDDLQHIAIAQIINETVRLEGIILKKEDSDENKSKALKALAETTETKIKALLSPAQIQKYEDLKTRLPEKKKSKKKK